MRRRRRRNIRVSLAHVSEYCCAFCEGDPVGEMVGGHQLCRRHWLLVAIIALEANVELPPSAVEIIRQ